MKDCARESRILLPPREGGLLRRLGARSRCFCCLDPVPLTEGGGRENSSFFDHVGMWHVGEGPVTFCLLWLPESSKMLHCGYHIKN